MDANPENNSRWDEIKRHWFVENVWLWLLPGLFMGGILGYLIGIRSTADLDDWFISGIWPEILSTCVAVALIYRLDRWRDNVRETQRLKRDLLWQVKSRSNEMAIGAIDRLRYEGWLEGENGLLAGADLSETNLAQANLNDANLKGTDFTGANLEGATFIRSELENSSFDLAFLAQACLYNADMSNASIWKTDLTGAKFQSTKAIGTRIRRSNLGDAFIGAFTDFEDAFICHQSQ